MGDLTPEQKRKLDTIQALLRMAENTGTTEAESSAFTSRAFELATKYMIDEAVIQAKGGSTDTVESRRGEAGRPFQQLLTLASVVYNHCGCRLIKHTADPEANIWDQAAGKSAKGTKYRNQKYTVIGFTSDLDRGLMLLTSLLVQGSRQVAADYRREGEPRGERRSVYYRSWWAQFTDVIYTRLSVIRDLQIRDQDDSSSEPNSTDTELVLAARYDIVNRKLEELFPSLKKTRGMSYGSGSGGIAGREAGQRADIGGRKIDGNTRAIER